MRITPTRKGLFCLPIKSTAHRNLVSLVNNYVGKINYRIGTSEDTIANIEDVFERSGVLETLPTLDHNWSSLLATYHYYHLLDRKVMSHCKGQLEVKQSFHD